MVPVLRPTEDGVHDSCQQRSWTVSRAAGFVPLPTASWLRQPFYCRSLLRCPLDVPRPAFWARVPLQKIPGIQAMTEIPALCCIVGNVVQRLLQCQSGLR